uniref:Tyrosinase n=1 Tax=Pinctada maxima TaxID=104660 RepID=A0A8U0BYU8_PINMA|nr:tyrosinase [Pinctada maxima]
MAGKTSQEITQDPTSYFHSLHRLALSEMYVARKKRSTFRRVRKEIRSLSMAERKDLFRAINDLKEDTSVFPNVYDSFANLHSGRILRSAYQGPNFLGWNRYYLYLFETALRSKNPKIVLPYWDSTLDFNMNDPSYTIMFSSEFMGNVDHTGALDSGPFKNWGIIRDIGQVGSLMSDELLDSILKNPRIIHHDQIVENGPGSSVHTIEGQQYNVHTWVGGMMADMKSSPKDPVFFFHRCFVDLVWELFREKQMSHGVDPESDYPNMGGLFHAPDRPMDGFPWVKNIDGYSNNFTDFIYQYDKRYTCPMCGGSRFLNCVRGKCVSVSTMAVNEAPMAAVSADMNVVNSHVGNFQSPLIMEKLYEITFNDTRIRGHPRPVIIVRNPSDPYLMSEGIVSAASAQIAASEEIRHKLQMKDSSRKRNLKKVPYQSNKMSDGIVKGDSEQEAIKQITPSSNAPKNVASNKVKLDKSLNTSDTSLLSDSSVAGTSTLEAVSEKLPFKEHTKATMDSSGN